MKRLLSIVFAVLVMLNCAIAVSGEESINYDKEYGCLPLDCECPMLPHRNTYYRHYTRLYKPRFQSQPHPIRYPSLHQDAHRN